jgi:cytochrome c biogenesis protein
LCIARNTPKSWCDLKVYKENIREQSLRPFTTRPKRPLAEPAEAEARRIGSMLASGGWKVKLQQRDTAAGPGTGWMVAAKAGRPTRSATSPRTAPSCWCVWAGCSTAT